MVIYLRSFLFCLLAYILPLQAANVDVTAEIDLNSSYENVPLKGTITITHDTNDKVDPSSFTMEGKELKTELVKEVQISPGNPLLLSIYSFQMPAKAQGLYLLPSIGVKVGDKKYSSIRSSYSVEPLTEQKMSEPQAPMPTPTSQTQTSGTPELKLEAFIKGNEKLYPGQHTTVVYRYLFNQSFDLEKEELPLLDAKGLIKIGEKEFNNYQQGEFSISEISQEVQADKPGEYSFGPSSIAGYAYKTEPSGKHVYISGKMTAEAPAVHLEVMPFPEKDKPSSFLGAIGKYQLDLSLNGAPKTRVNEEISVTMTLTGKGNLQQVKLPDLCCLPGFSGFFRTSDLPPEEVVEGETKRAVISLWPLSDKITEIPSVAFSYFDPETSRYGTVHTKPIPLTVLPENVEKQVVPEVVKEKKPEPKKTEIFKPSPIEIAGIYSLSIADLRNYLFGTWWALGILPIGIGLILYQQRLHRYLELQKSEQKESPQEVMQQAWLETPGSSKYYDTIERALKSSLFEGGWIKNPEVPNSELSSEGMVGEVKQFLQSMERGRFSGVENPDNDEIRRKAEALLESLDKARR